MCESRYQMRSITRISSTGRSEDRDALARESSVQVRLNGNTIGLPSCTPCELAYLAVGFLFTHHLIESYEQIVSVSIKKTDTYTHRIDVTCMNANTAGKAGEQEKRGVFSTEQSSAVYTGQPPSAFNISSASILACMRQFENATELFQRTGATHSCGLYDPLGYQLILEDIRRSNALDKLIGYCLTHRVDTTNKILLVSGRISVDLVDRATRLQIPVVASPSAPTDWAIELANEKDITIIGFARGGQMNIYTHAERILLG